VGYTCGSPPINLGTCDRLVAEQLKNPSDKDGFFNYVVFVLLLLASVRRQEEQALILSPAIVKICKLGFCRRGTIWLEWLRLLARTACLEHN
jgi:hypothetical protein